VNALVAELTTALNLPLLAPQNDTPEADE